MHTINKKWVIYVYIIFLVTIILTLITFIFRHITGNLDIYFSVKSYFISYGKELWLKEAMITNYFDNPKNIYYIDTKTFRKDELLSRYKNFLEYTLDAWEIFELSLTSFDEEYNNNLKKLNYIDLYWSWEANKCDLNISKIRWEKDNINTILNNKEQLHNKKILNISSVFSKENTIYIEFSSWAYYNSGPLETSNFILNNNYNILSISWSQKNYELLLDTPLDPKIINTISLVSWEVKASNGDDFQPDIMVIKSSPSVYKMRYRLKDSFESFNKNTYEYKLLLHSDTLCTFYLEGFDSNHYWIKLPSTYLSWEINNLFDKTISIVKKIKIWSIELSHYLYKL